MFISDYLKETEEELIAQGKAEGKVEGAIQTYLELLSKDEAIDRTMSRFNLTKEEVLNIIEKLNK